MSLPKKITVAVTTYRRKNILDKCLNSFLNQKNKFKILLIDNDFKKSAFKTFLKFKNRLNIEYLVEPSKNVSKARNMAIKNCKTKYLAFIDDDCVLSPNWSVVALSIVKANKEIVFFQGGSVSSNLKNKLVLAQNQIYQNWIRSNLKNGFIDQQALDTKNIIFNLEIISKHKIFFDVNLANFEDVDFGLQIKQIKLLGKFVPEMSVEHFEISDFKKVIKKFYFRGKLKYLLNQKWHNFDNFSPKLITELKNKIRHPFPFYQNILDLTFKIGFMMARKQKIKINKNKIYIVNYADGSANQERWEIVSEFLKKENYSVENVDSQILFEKNINNLSGFWKNPLSFIRYRMLRFLIFKFKLKVLKPYLFYEEIILRGNFIRNYLNKNRAIMVISQYPKDFSCGLGYKKYKLILDLPTIYSEEIKGENKLNVSLIKKIELMEKKVFSQENYVCFHWYSFLDLAKKIKKMPKKSFVLNWGCKNIKKTADFKKKPKMVYVGNLNSSWINYKLLESVQNKTIVPVDIYSYEKPDKNNYSFLKFKGFMKNINELKNYQFGLLTFTEDQLRNNGFSAKHLVYLSYGLPVLCPEWRKDKLLESATIYYNSKNINYQIKKYSQKKNWNKKHLAAIKLSKKLEWKQTLKSILPIIYEIQNEI